MKTNQRITIQDISRRARVSPSTVSRVLTGSATVSQEKRAAVEEAIQSLNYKPSLIARSLRTNKTFSLGLLVNDITNPFYSNLARGVEEEALDQGYSLILCNINEDPERELHYLKVLRSKHVDGIILGPTGGNSEFIVEISQQIPTLLVDREITGSNIGVVTVDNEWGAYQATRYLLQRGHQNIGLATWQQDILTMRQRFAGYQRALDEYGLHVDLANIMKVPRLTAETTDEIAQQFLKRDTPPTAMFALNNQLGLGVLSAIHRLGLRIPHDIALVVFDDLSIFSLYTPPISVVRQPAFEIGTRAIQRLLQEISEPASYTPQVDILPTELVIRDFSLNLVGERGRTTNEIVFVSKLDTSIKLRS